MGTLRSDSINGSVDLNYNSLGYRGAYGDFFSYEYPAFWTDQEYDLNNAYGQTDESAYYLKNSGFSVRLFMDDPSGWTDGDLLIYKGVQYRTAQLSDGSVCMIDNLMTDETNEDEPI